MMDLTRGSIEIKGVQITPEITQDCFERENTSNGFVFEREDLSESVTLFSLNGWVCRLPTANFDSTKHQEFVYNGMRFLNVVVLFRNNRIEKIELISDLQPYAIDKEGHRTYSPQKEEDCYNQLLNWAKSCFGTPNNNNPYSATSWNFEWGCFRPTPGSPHGSSTNIFLVEYGRDYRA